MRPVHHSVRQCHTCLVPTTRPRHQITETEDIGKALDLAARRWPGESRGSLLLRLVGVGGSVLAEDESRQLTDRRSAIEQTSGKYTGMFEKDYLRNLRDEWPE